MGINWGGILPTAIGAGATIGGQILQNKSANRQNDLVADQVARKNAAQDQLMRVLGLPGLGGGGGMGGGMASQATAQGPSGLSKGLGMAGAGMGVASAIPGIASKLGGVMGAAGKFLPFIGPALGALAFGANKIGQGRRTADSFVQKFQNPFYAKPNKTAQDYADYRAAINSMIGSSDKNQQKVGNQALATARQYEPDLFR